MSFDMLTVGLPGPLPESLSQILDQTEAKMLESKHQQMVSNFE